MKKFSAYCALVLMGATLTVLPNQAANAMSVGGPYHLENKWIGAKSTQSWAVRYYCHETAWVKVWGSTDLDIKVYDEDGNLVVSDTLSNTHPVCEWTPEITQTYTIKVINSEDRSGTYYLDTN